MFPIVHCISYISWLLPWHSYSGSGNQSWIRPKLICKLPVKSNVSFPPPSALPAVFTLSVLHLCPSYSSHVQVLHARTPCHPHMYSMMLKPPPSIYCRPYALMPYSLQHTCTWKKAMQPCAFLQS